MKLGWRDCNVKMISISWYCTASFWSRSDIGALTKRMTVALDCARWRRLPAKIAKYLGSIFVAMPRLIKEKELNNERTGNSSLLSYLLLGFFLLMSRNKTHY